MTLALRRPNQARERLLGECLDEEACEVLWEDEHNKGAVVLSKAINDFKGFYVKVGQIIARTLSLSLSLTTAPAYA